MRDATHEFRGPPRGRTRTDVSETLRQASSRRGTDGIAATTASMTPPDEALQLMAQHTAARK